MVSKKVNFDALAKEVIQEHNNIRKNPSSYIPLLEEQLKYFKGNVYTRPGEIGIQTHEGPAVVKEAIEFLKKQAPIKEGIEHNSSVAKACKDHAEDIGPKGLFEHTGSDGSSCSDRIERYAKWNITCGESIDFGATNGKDVIISLCIDDGVSTRGHRNNLFNPKFKVFGVCSNTHKELGSCTVIAYVGEILNENGNGKSSSGGSKNEIKDITDKLKNTKIVRGDDPFKDDPDAPKDAVSCSTNIETKTCGNKKTVTTTKKYTTSDGSTVTKTKIEETTTK